MSAPGGRPAAAEGRPLRIVRMANFVTPSSGGLRTALDRLGRGYRAAGHEPVLIVPGAGPGDERTPQGRVITLPGPEIAGTGGYRVLTARRRLRALLEELAPDRIEVSDRTTLRWTGEWARRQRVPSVMVSHETADGVLRTWGVPGAAAAHAADRLNRRSAWAYSRIVCTTEWAEREFVRIGARNLVRAPLGVDLDHCRPDRRRPALRAELAAGADVLLLLCSRLSVEKRPGTALDTLAALRAGGTAAALVVAGDGPLRPALERRAAEERLPVSFLGHLTDRGAVADLQAAADLCLAPGPAETFGLAALEALACGTPVVCAPTSALPEVLGDAGAAAAGSSGPDHAAAALRLLAVPEQERRHAARARAELFDWPTAVRAFLAAHEAPHLPDGGAARSGRGAAPAPAAPEDGPRPTRAHPPPGAPDRPAPAGTRAPVPPPRPRPGPATPSPGPRIHQAGDPERPAGPPPSAAPPSAAPPSVVRPVRGARSAGHGDGARNSPDAPRPLRFAALGDSLTEGVGDPVGDAWRGWAALLADGLGHRERPAVFRNLAVGGALSSDVADTQLPRALAFRPDLASVVVGVNDTLRRTFDTNALARRLDEVLGALDAGGTVLLTACLPDPGSMLALPSPLARPLARRQRAVNAVVHALSERYGTVHLHAADASWVADRALWSADRLHPGERGHRMLARSFHRQLAARGLDLGPEPSTAPDGPGPTRAQAVAWLATAGTGWIARRCTDLVPQLLRLAAEEVLHRAGGTAERLDHAARAETSAALAALPPAPRRTGSATGAEAPAGARMG
ncbi:hypothetical protein GCM10023329_46930 [Streptomyces sanyensis]|uniref:Glycosyl transferase n=1 Tax=Streptomyces sanyensis TaxID=568869 RepID=A0ABP9B4S2_9ACTN